MGHSGMNMDVLLNKSYKNKCCPFRIFFQIINACFLTENLNYMNIKNYQFS